jgi:hypothetical protein
MSVFKDNTDVTAATWYSSPWSKYRFTPKRHVIEQASGDDHDMIWWIADDAWVGKTVTMKVNNNLGAGGAAGDGLNFVGYDSYSSTEEFATRFGATGGALEYVRDGQSNKRFWVLPGVGMQWGSSVTHYRNSYTEETIYTKTFTTADLGDKMLDGGMHCWVQLPTSVTAFSTGIPTHPLLMDVIKNRPFLLQVNSYGHVIPSDDSPSTPQGLTISLEGSEVVNPSHSVDLTDWHADTVDLNSDSMPDSIICGDWDLNDLDGNDLHMGAPVIVDGRTNIASKNLRLKLQTENLTGDSSEETFRANQYIMLSIYPL